MMKLMPFSKNFIKILLFFTFFCVLSSAGAILGYFPFILIGLLIELMRGSAYFPLEFSSVIIYFAPILVIILPFLIMIKTRNKNFFFIVTFLTVVISYCYGYSYIYPNLNSDLFFFATAFLYMFLITYTIYKTWIEVFIYKRVSHTLFLVVLLFDTVLAIFESNTMLGSDNISIYNTYIDVGEFLNQFYKFDFFWLDYSGFAILFINILNCILTLSLLYVPRLLRR